MGVRRVAARKNESIFEGRWSFDDQMEHTEFLMDDDVRGWAHRSRIGSRYFCVYVCIYIYVCVCTQQRAGDY